MKIILALFCFVVLSCSNNQEEPLHYNKIYTTEQLENEATGDEYRYFLKFYEDGTVIGVTSSGTANDIKNWFKKGHEQISEGEYEIEEDEISFATSNQYGDIEYTGTIKDKETLKLQSTSSNNGNKAKLTFSLAEED